MHKLVYRTIIMVSRARLQGVQRHEPHAEQLHLPPPPHRISIPSRTLPLMRLKVDFEGTITFISTPFLSLPFFLSWLLLFQRQFNLIALRNQRIKIRIMM